MPLLNDRIKLELSRSRRPAMQVLFLVGVGIFCATILLKNQFYDRFWQEKFEFKASFADVKGVTPGVQRVKIAGVQAGVVSDSEVVDGRPVLTIKLDKDKGPVYKDAKLRLRPLTPLQDMYVTIEDRGTAKAGELSKDDVLPAARTESPVDISRVLNEFPGATRQRLQTLLDEFGNGLEDRGQDLREAFAAAVPFLKAADRTATVVADRRSQMARLVTNLGVITTALGKRDRQLSSLVQNGNSTLAELNKADGELSATLNEIPPTLTTLRSAFAKLRSAQDDLDPALDDLRPVAAELSEGLDALEKLGKDAKPALEGLKPALADLRPFSRSLRPTSDALAAAMAKFRPQGPQYDRITSQIPPCFDQVGNFFNDTLSVLKFYDAYGAFPRGDDSEDLDTVGGVAKPLGHTRSPTCAKGPTK
ncbi:MlaD family protein [Conexibacter sp. SYSU D00693]|uniref:MlaD family protein n=1 Tax=Conexibacter sp. SYSU D00693 TaxID=2812560 RepID=UPI00196BB0DC|nr:MlaD family protein [Conexibacter sp. SYSU D00693]